MRHPLPSRSLAGALLLAAGLISLVILSWTAGAQDPPSQETLQTLYEDGNFLEAYRGFRLRLLAGAPDATVRGDVEKAVASLKKLKREAEVDRFLEEIVEAHPDQGLLLWKVAETYMKARHRGRMIAGEFRRAERRGGETVFTFDRDRVRALQLYDRARRLLPPDLASVELADFYRSYGMTWRQQESQHDWWRLQIRTSLDELPDYRREWYWSEGRGAPVDEDGQPVFFALPASLEAAKNDGERMRWCLARSAEVHADSRYRASLLLQRAEFLRQQLGVQTVRRYGLGALAVDETREGPFTMHTLKESETIARLTSGVQRVTLPDEHNFIRIYQDVARSDDEASRQQAWARLAGIFEDRRQLGRAAAMWRQLVEDSGGTDAFEASHRLQKIVGYWGRFEGVERQPAGTGATVEFRFRNGTQVDFEAYEIDASKLLADAKEYLESGPDRIDRDRIQIQHVGQQLINRKQERYRGKRVAAWSLDLKPRPDHQDRRVTVTTPLQEAGAYLLTARMKGGNTSHVTMWVQDTVIVRKTLGDGMLYFVADAVTGRPIPGAQIEIFGYRQERVSAGKYEIQTSEIRRTTDADGQATVSAEEHPHRWQWVATARKNDDRFAYVGFSHTWYPRRADRHKPRDRAFVITDRPVYRPDQEMKFKVWVGTARYDADREESEHAGRVVQVRIQDPRRQKILEKEFTCDAFGGFEGTFPLASDARLGRYRIEIVKLGSGSFRVEEYKKPEFEVTVESPEKPIALGETFPVTVKARYYYGSPVTEGTVSYTIYRTTSDETWFPPCPWDWLYGAGYGWLGGRHAWYPGWDRWGCTPPGPWWDRSYGGVPEVVAQDEAPIGADGTVRLEIDSSLAKTLRPDMDHRYRVVAEVVDASRRTVVGEGQVIAAREPFRVTIWTDRGFYRAGATMRGEIAARTPDGRPVEASGKVQLLEITYKGDDPQEKVAHEWEVTTDATGRAQFEAVAARAGQYRISCTLEKDGHSTEGGMLVSILGGRDAPDFRYNSIELTADRPEYAPGDRVELLVSTDRPGSTVVFFARPENGVYPRPQILRLEKRQQVVNLDVTRADVPNFFVEAFTVSDGRLHREARRLVVPPRTRLVNVAVEPSATEYRPGAPAKVRVAVTDQDGEPFAGSTVISIYDRAVEAIAGGSNVPRIGSFFWSWTRSHRPEEVTNIRGWSGNMVAPGDQPMVNIGIFGDWVKPGSRITFGDTGVEEQGRGKRLASRSRALPEAAPAAGGILDFDDGETTEEADSEDGGWVEPEVRSEFADTALWVGNVTTGADGIAEVSLDMPENLTSWKVRAWTIGRGTRVGQGEAEVVTRKNLLLRLQAPRFFTERDEVILSANIHNELATAKMVRATLELDGHTLGVLDAATKEIRIDASSEARVDWRVRVQSEGEAVVRMIALTDEESDAMEMRFPVHVHGMLRQEAIAGSLRPDQNLASVPFSVPEDRRPEASRVEVRFSPSLAAAIVDALPYLADYPHGCTEQTLNRFLPAAITRKALQDTSLDLAAIQEKRANLNAQEIGDPAERARGWKRFDRNPVFDEATLTKMITQGLEALGQMQLSDGGWGWFSGWGERSSAHTTATVVRGLVVAAKSDLPVDARMLERGLEWLKTYRQEQLRRIANAATKTRPWKNHADDLDAYVHHVLVDAGHRDQDMENRLYEDRTKLSVYAKALLGLALFETEEEKRLAMVLRNIEQFLEQDDENDTAYLRVGSSWWCWYDSETEANAYYLKLLTRTQPDGEVAPRLVKYLVNNRKHASYWRSTRDTALCVEALVEYLDASDELDPDMTVEVWLDGQKRKEVSIDAGNLFTCDNTFVLTGDAVTSGAHTLELRRRGEGPLYYNLYFTNFTKEDSIPRAGLELKVHRRYYRLVPEEATEAVSGDRGQALEQRVSKFRREPLEDGAVLTSGDLVEVELHIESKNDYEYLLFEDLKPAGFEAVDLRSGYVHTGLWAYRELRDRHVGFYVTRLPRGEHSLSYRVRAEIPGRFSALPTLASAMYAPELRGNSDEIHVTIEDR